MLLLWRIFMLWGTVELCGWDSYSSAVVTVSQPEKYWSEEWELFFFVSSVQNLVQNIVYLSYMVWSITHEGKMVKRWLGHVRLLNDREQYICDMFQVTTFVLPESINEVIEIIFIKKKTWVRIDTARFWWSEISYSLCSPYAGRIDCVTQETDRCSYSCWRREHRAAETSDSLQTEKTQESQVMSTFYFHLLVKWNYMHICRYKGTEHVICCMTCTGVVVYFLLGHLRNVSSGYLHT